MPHHLVAFGHSTPCYFERLAHCYFLSILSEYKACFDYKIDNIAFTHSTSLYIIDNTIAKLVCSISIIDERIISDHAGVLRDMYADVSAKLEAQSVARNMFQCNALTLKELQRIQAQHSEPIKAAERLINIVSNQSSIAYRYFLNALKTTGQQHVYEMIIVGSYRGESSF